MKGRGGKVFIWGSYYRTHINKVRFSRPFDFRQAKSKEITYFIILFRVSLKLCVAKL